MAATVGGDGSQETSSPLAKIVLKLLENCRKITVP